MKRDTFLESVSYWPLNISSGPEFLGVYVVLAVVVFAVSRFVQLIVLSGLDGRLPEAQDGPMGYRRAFQPGATMRVGTLPSAADVYRIAYLRGGHDAVADALIAQACAQGWLRSFDVVGAVAHDAPSEVQRFHAAVVRLPHRDAATIRRAAKDLDPRWIESTREALIAQGFWRPFGRRLVAALFVLFPMTLVVWLGGLRVVRGVMLDRPVAFLVLLLLAVTAVSLWLAFPAKKTTHAERYLAWLDGATTSLRANATQGAARTEHDWLLAAALGGAAAVPVIAFYQPPSFTQRAAGDASSSGGSCGSSCGSSCGGGCGGGGCGG